MKFKVFLCVASSIVACTIGCIFSGCGNRQWYDQIKYDYVRQNNYRVDELSLDVYGEYNGTYVFIIDGPWGYPGIEVGTVEIGGVEFYFSSPRIPEAYNNGSFYSLQEAYDEQLLTHNDLVDVNKKFISGEYATY